MKRFGKAALGGGILSIWTGRQFSVKEAREEDIHRALRGETVPPAPVEASPLEPAD
jgi:hypothetical protein